MNAWLRPSVLALCVLGAGFAALGASCAAAQRAQPQNVAAAQLVAELGLSDVVLFTQASYVRHLSLSEARAAWQEHPMALDHFPATSLVAPARP